MRMSRSAWRSSLRFALWEWTLSPWLDSYEGREGGMSFDPTVIEAPVAELPGGTRRVMRGGAFWEKADRARSAYRVIGNPAFVDINLGFRVVIPHRTEPRT